MAGTRLILVDAMGVLYRAHFAIRELSTASGQPTNAVFGFVRLVKQLADQWHPTHWAVVFDGGRPEGRVLLLAEYKAQRPPMPDALREQLPLVHEYLAGARIAEVRLDGYEADDVMASIAAQAGRGADEVLVATGDKDMYQLVDDRVAVVAVVGKAARFGPAQVEEKTGVSPSLIPAWLALTGDASDNIPGVPGVGPKTAAKLLAQFGSLDQLWSRLHEVGSDKLRTTLAASRELVDRNLELVRLVSDLSCPLAWDDLAMRSPDRDRLLAFYEGLEFHSLARELREPTLFAE